MDVVNRVRDRMRDRVRTLLKVREPRAIPPAGPRPAPGARIFSGRERMTVQSGMPPGLWDWLVAMGWREARFQPDRRRYDDIPKGWVLRLYRARDDERLRILRAAVAAARGRNPSPPELF